MKLLLFIIALFIIIYIYCYFIYPNEITILQTNLSDFTFDLLLKRQPLVIEDCVENIIPVIDAWFSYNIVDDVSFETKRLWNINYHKYLLIYSLSDTEVLLYKAGNKVIDDVPDDQEPVLAIQLKQYQSVIVPYRWYYNIKNINDVKLYGIHDYITNIVEYFI